MIELNESNFKEEVNRHPRMLVFFYREKGCGFCDKMKPIFEAHKPDGYQLGQYKLGPAPDSVTQDLVQKFPTFAAFLNGQLVNKAEGVLAEEKFKELFEPKPVPVSQAPFEGLLKAEAALMDNVYPLLMQLKEIREEIKKRREVTSV